MATNVKKPDAADANNSLTNEIVGIILLAVGVLLALCLLTYNSADPSFNTASRETTANFTGSIGANIAAVLLQTFGLAAYVLPILTLLVAWRAFWSESLIVPLVRVVGFVLLVIGLSALLPLLGFGLFFDKSVPAGGLIGAFVAGFLSAGLGVIGSVVLLLAVCAAAFLLVSGVSYQPLIVQIKLWVDALRQKISDWREHEKHQSKLRFEKRRDARLNSLLESERSQKNQDLSVGSDAVKKLNGKPAQAADETTEIIEENIFSVTFSRVAGSLRSFLERLKHPPEESKPERKNEKTAESPAASNEFSETVGTDDFREKIEIVPRPAKNESARKSAAQPKDDSETDDVLAADELSDDFDQDITIQPLKYGDAVEPEFANENGLKSDPETNAPKPRVHIPLGEYELPPSEYLNEAPARIQHADTELLDIAHTLTDKCREFKANGSVVNICPGPVVTTYEYKLDAGVKFTTISGLVDDLCLGLQAESVRIDRIPGKAYVGVEVPNPRRETIFLREVLESRSFHDSKSLLSIALGKTVDGLNYTADLSKMPHLLIAGATGAGKSVGVNGLIVSILYKARPDEVKFIMIDPKQVELNLYADIPHLATPIITDPKRAAIALKWAVVEMERRYKVLSSWYTRNIDGYNAEVHRRNAVKEFDENGDPYKALPYIVIIVDEFADLMMVARGEVEESITRLAQKARAVGVHLVLATQRPSVDVVTGLIKANFPCRIAFRVSSSIDSKTIIGGGGAEHLLGRGDMLFLPPGTSRLMRIHGAFVDENEIQKIVEHIKAQSAPEYDTTITQTEEELGGADFDEENQDDLFADALKICVEMKRASTSVLQRRLSIGYGRAAKIIDAMEHAGYVGASEGASKPRPILDKAYERVSDWREQDN